MKHAQTFSTSVTFWHVLHHLYILKQSFLFHLRENLLLLLRSNSAGETNVSIPQRITRGRVFKIQQQRTQYDRCGQALDLVQTVPFESVLDFSQERIAPVTKNAANFSRIVIVIGVRGRWKRAVTYGAYSFFVVYYLFPLHEC